MTPAKLRAPLAAALVLAAGASLADDVADLVATDRRMQHAFVTRDLAALDEILADDYVLVLWNGNERTKPEVLASVRAEANRWEINETSGWQVRIAGDTAIVVATLHQKGVADGRPFDSRVKFSDTYVREHGRWRNLHAHASKAVDTVAAP
ncbi:MAG TPA: nuclear transport factor 2 family protein [Xanthomonadales bacterium]|nr:nuclear transport factor 2 family protein [Xanthomonadales bacterium]